MPQKRVRTLDERVGIIEEVERNPSESRISVAKRLGLPVSTLNSIIAKKDEIREQYTKFGASAKKRKTSKKSPNHDMEEILVKWFQQARSSNIPVNGSMLKEKALQVATRLGIENFSASNGWIDRFRQRHGLVYKMAWGERAAVNTHATQHWKEELTTLIEGYVPQDIFIADECGLFFNLSPDQILTYNGEECREGKLSNERLTVLLCTNSDGSQKLTPLVIGKLQKPYCFQNIKTLPTIYTANAKAWMTSVIFLDFLRSLDTKMGAQRRKVLLFVDHCEAHPSDVGFLTNVKVIFFSITCTSHPLGLGIIHNFKQFYRKQLMQTELAHMEQAISRGKAASSHLKVNVLQALHYILSAWLQVKSTTIKNCFGKCGFGINECGAIKDEDTEEDLSVDWAIYRQNQANSMTFEEFVNVDNALAICGEPCSENATDKSEEDDNSLSREVGDPDHTLPTFFDAVEALETLKLYYYGCKVDDDILNDLIKVEQTVFGLKTKENVKQVKTDSYFAPVQ